MRVQVTKCLRRSKQRQENSSLSRLMWFSVFSDYYTKKKVFRKYIHAHTLVLWKNMHLQTKNQGVAYPFTHQQLGCFLVSWHNPPHTPKFMRRVCTFGLKSQKAQGSSHGTGRSSSRRAAPSTRLWPSSSLALGQSSLFIQHLTQ